MEPEWGSRIPFKGGLGLGVLKRGEVRGVRERQEEKNLCSMFRVLCSVRIECVCNIKE